MTQTRRAAWTAWTVGAMAGTAAAGEVLPLPAPPADAAGWGSAVALVGDLDDDGTPDFAVGAPETSVAGFYAGRVHAVSGATGKVLFHFDGIENQQVLGNAVAPAGDFDEDGVPDLLAAATGTGDRRLPPGYAVVISGRTRQQLVLVRGSSTAGDFGRGMTVLGDVNGDGTADLAVGEPGDGPGAVAVFSGADGVRLWRVTGALGDGLGAGVVALPDLDKDGRPDLAVAAPLQGSLSGPPAGKVLLLSGADGRLLRTIAGKSPDRLGLALAAGDVDGDGRVDLLVSGAGGGGFVRAYDPAKGKLLARISTPSDADEFGAALVALPDLDGVPGAEFAVGSVGRAYVHSFGGRVARELARIDGPAETSFGLALCAAPDAGGVAGPPDGTPDLLIAQPFDGAAGVYALDVQRTLVLPKSLSLKTPLVRAAAAAGKGSVAVSVKGGRVSFTVSALGIPAGDYFVHLETGVGTGDYDQIGELTGGKLTLVATGDLPAALRARDFAALGGRRVEVREAAKKAGDVTMSAVIPYVGAPKGKPETLIFAASPGDDGLTAAKGSIKLSETKTGGQRMEVSVAGAPKDATLFLFAAAPGASEPVQIAELKGGRFVADSGTGAWPFDASVRSADLVLYGFVVKYVIASDVLLRVREGLHYVASAPKTPKPDFRIEKIRLSYDAHFDAYVVKLEVKNRGTAAAGPVNVLARLNVEIAGSSGFTCAFDEASTRSTVSFPVGAEETLPLPWVNGNCGGAPQAGAFVKVTAFVDPVAPGGAAVGEHVELDEFNNATRSVFEWAFDEDDQEFEFKRRVTEETFDASGSWRFRN